MYGYELKTEIHGALVVQEAFSVVNDVRERIWRQVLDTGEGKTREKLIELGWSPPVWIAPLVPDEDRYFPFEFEVWQGGEMLASASGPRDTALREAMRYAAQYGQDSPVRVFEVTRILVSP
jgi:hypothetical protein